MTLNNLQLKLPQFNQQKNMNKNSMDKLKNFALQFRIILKNQNLKKFQKF